MLFLGSTLLFGTTSWGCCQKGSFIPDKYIIWQEKLCRFAFGVCTMGVNLWLQMMILLHVNDYIVPLGRFTRLGEVELECMVVEAHGR